MKDDIIAFEKQCDNEIQAMVDDSDLRETSLDYLNRVAKHNYAYHFKWMGMPIIQFPQDIIAMQELIFQIKPDYIIETGIARGGSLVFYASMLELLGNRGKVIGVDIDIRNHNKKRIESHPMNKNITLIQGSSTDNDVIAQIDEVIAANNFTKGLVVLDSLHTHAHVLEELRLYNKYVGKGSYLVAFDTVIEYLTEENIGKKPWGKGDNPFTAVYEFLKENDRFIIDEAIESKLLVTVCPSGFLKCIK
jgi:cephalosporin hydroxylase